MVPFTEDSRAGAGQNILVDLKIRTRRENGAISAEKQQRRPLRPHEIHQRHQEPVESVTPVFVLGQISPHVI